MSISKGKAAGAAWLGAAGKLWVFPRHGDKLPDLSPTQKCPCNKPLFALAAAALRDQIQGHVRVLFGEIRFRITCDFCSLAEQCQ